MRNTGPLTKEKKIENIRNFFNSEEFKEIREDHMKNMSRTEKREYQRHEEKLKKCINGLTPLQLELVDKLAETKATDDFERFIASMDRCVSTFLYDLYPDKNTDEILKIETILEQLLYEDTKKINNMKIECKGDIKMVVKTLKKYESEIKERITELLDGGISQKKAIEILTDEFPKLSKSMITNGYKKMKTDWDKEREEVISDPDVVEAAEAIMEIIEDKEIVKIDEITVDINNTTDNTDIKQIEKDINKEDEVMNEPVKQGLKVLTMTVQGENGKYEVQQGKGVILSRENSSIYFSNVQELEQWTKEFAEVFKMIS